MKKTYLLFCLLLCAFLTNTTVKAQAPAIRHIIYGSSPFQDSLWGIDTTTWQVVTRLGPTLPGFTITGMNGLAYDPTTHETYIIMKLATVTGRVLGKINLTTGVCTQVGNLNDNFSSITFRADGQLMGATGNGATVPEALYLIDKNTAAKTLLYAMGNGADGEIILYNRSDNFIYHWSGNSTMVFEKMAASAVTYTPTNIPVVGTPGGETFGALYVRPDYFIMSNISSSLIRLNPQTGTYNGPAFASLPDDLRGLVMPPQVAFSTDSLCQGSDTLFAGMGNLHLFDSISYHWGDNTSTTYAAGATAASHVYATSGSYTVSVLLDNGVVRDTAFTYVVQVNAAPVVTLSGPSALCPNDTVMLIGSSGGNNQWYMNGMPVAAATTDTLTVFTPGVYNMVETNLNGCSDSSATSITLGAVPNPTVALGQDISACVSATLDAGNPGATYLWSTAGTQQTETVTASGSYNVLVTDSNNCSASDTLNVVINPLPVVDLGADTATCVSVTLNAGNAGATYLWSTTGTQQTETITASGSYFVTVTDTNTCSQSDTVNVVINALPTVSLSTTVTSICVGDAFVVLTGTPAGGTYNGPSLLGNLFDPGVGAGSYAIVYDYTDANGCSSVDTLTLVVGACVGITEQQTLAYDLFPNPTTGSFTIQLPEAGAQLIITDVQGQIVRNEQLLNSGATAIDLNAQAAGVYFVKVTIGTTTSVSRLVICR